MCIKNLVSPTRQRFRSPWHYLDMLIPQFVEAAVYLQLLIAYKSTTKRDREIYVKYPRDAILIWSTTVVVPAAASLLELACSFR